MKLTFEMIKHIMPNATAARINTALPSLESTAIHYEINNQKRLSAWLATIAQESGELRYNAEIASGSAYEGRRDLGNTQKGDGPRFKGHGKIQITGRDAHEAYTEYIRQSGHVPFVDFTEEPQKLAQEPYSTDSAGWFVNGYKQINYLADADNFLLYSVRVNGRNKRTGLPNNWAERQAYYERALEIIPEDFSFDDPDVPAVATPPPDEPPVPKVSTVTATTTTTQETPAGSSTQQVSLQSSTVPTNTSNPSIFTKWMTAIKVGVGSMIATVASYVGGGQLQTAVTSKVAQRIDDPSFLYLIAVAFTYIALGVGAGVFLIWIASIFYARSAKNHTQITETLIATNANPTTNNIKLV